MAIYRSGNIDNFGLKPGSILVFCISEEISFPGSVDLNLNSNCDIFSRWIFDKLSDEQAEETAAIAGISQYTLSSLCQYSGTSGCQPGA